MLHVDQANYLYTMSSSAGFRVHHYAHVSFTSGEILQRHLQFSFMWGVDYYQGCSGARMQEIASPHFFTREGGASPTFFKESMHLTVVVR